LDDDAVGGQQKQSPEEGIPEGGPIPLHQDTTISDSRTRRGIPKMPKPTGHAGG